MVDLKPAGKIQFKGFDVDLSDIEIKPRFDLHPDWVMFRFRTSEKGDEFNTFVVPTKFYFGDYLFEMIEEPAPEGWMMTKVIRDHKKPTRGES